MEQQQQQQRRLEQQQSAAGGAGGGGETTPSAIPEEASDNDDGKEAGVATSNMSSSQDPKQEQQQQQPQQQQQQQSWVGWMLGYGTSTQTDASANGVSSPPPTTSAHHPLSISPPGASDTPPPTAPGPSSPPPAASTALRASSSGSLTSPFQPDHLSPAFSARRIVADDAWDMLHSGRLCDLVRLQAAVCFLPGGLKQIMEEGRLNRAMLRRASSSSSRPTSPILTPNPSPRQSEVQGGLGNGAGAAEISAVELLSSLALAVEELPVWSGPDVEAEAHEAHALVRNLPGPEAASWSLALAVLLADATEVQAFKARQQKAWTNFVSLLKGDPTFSYMYDLVDLVDS